MITRPTGSERTVPTPGQLILVLGPWAWPALVGALANLGLGSSTYSPSLAAAGLIALIFAASMHQPVLRGEGPGW